MSKQSFLNFHCPSRKPSLKPAQLSSFKERQRSNLSTKTFQPNVEEMKRVFDKFDTNNDGKISPNEYKAILKGLGKSNAEMEVAKTFEVLDTDGDGFIDFKEFMEVYNMGGGVSTTEIQSAFQVFDLDGNGKISAEELLEVLKRLGQRFNLEACRKMIKGVDADGDGLVDMDEFMSMLTQKMKLF